MLLLLLFGGGGRAVTPVPPAASAFGGGGGGGHTRTSHYADHWEKLHPKGPVETVLDRMEASMKEMLSPKVAVAKAVEKLTVQPFDESDDEEALFMLGVF